MKTSKRYSPEVRERAVRMVFETLITFTLAGQKEKTSCPPENFSGKQLTKIYIKHANENPEKLHRPANHIAISAFMKAFPCK